MTTWGRDRREPPARRAPSDGRRTTNAISRPGRCGDLTDEDDLIDAELPTDFLDLRPIYLYLSVIGREFMQQMQMT